MTRNLVSGDEDSASWLREGSRISQIRRLSSEAILLGVKKTRQKWIQSSRDPAVMADILENVPSTGKHQEVSIEADFVFGGVDRKPEELMPDLLLEASWIESLDRRRLTPRDDEDSFDSWDRILGSILPLAREIDVLDPYFFNDLRREPSVTAGIFVERLARYNIPVRVHCIAANLKSDLSDSGSQKILESLRNRMGSQAGPKLEVRQYQDKIDRGSETHRFHRDRYVYATFDRGSLLWSLGHGLEVFDPRFAENQLGEQPASDWLKIRANLDLLASTGGMSSS
ncbi:hypothetical protein N8716_00910 [Pontimonas sp.]|nr:hypothetical protein [Pontimonas sp.]